MKNVNYRLLTLFMILAPTLASANDNLKDGACLVHAILCEKMKTKYGADFDGYVSCVEQASLGVGLNVAKAFTSQSGLTFLQASKQVQIIKYINGNEFTDADIKEAQSAFAIEAQAQKLSILKNGRKLNKLSYFNTARDCN